MGLKNNQQRELAMASKLPPMGLGSAICSWEQERSLSALCLVQDQPSLLFFLWLFTAWPHI